MSQETPNRRDAEVLRLFDSIGGELGYSIGDAASLEAIIARGKSAFEKARSSPILLHGHRVEKMFGYVSAALGRCRLVREEDGTQPIFLADKSLKTPDYRVVLDSGDQLLIEVKNCHGGSSNPKLVLDSAYVEALQGYCGLFGVDLRIAIYWSRWRLWSLVPIRRFSSTNGRREIAMLDALRFNEMGRLGEVMIGTLPRLRMRLVADRSKKRAATKRGDDTDEVIFTVAAVEFYCGDNRIDDAKEKSLAYYFMMYGSWLAQEPRVEMEGGKPLFFEFESIRSAMTPNKGSHRSDS